MAWESYAPEAREETEKIFYFIFSVSSQSRSLFSASFQTFCLTTRAYLNTQKYGLFCSLLFHMSSFNCCKCIFFFINE